jgi:peptidoglycan/xylan/chitin deacetylase (PgdA/CDA1 family)
VGTSTYAQFAVPYGASTRANPTDLFHYPYQGKNQDIDRLVKDHGYTTYYAGGKYGRPDLANRNYNTKHLMIYDPSPGLVVTSDRSLHGRLAEDPRAEHTPSRTRS